MQLKIHSIEISADDPFSSDLLNRKEEIENLTLLVQNINSPAVLAINSGWGTGKTTFIKMWNAYLKKQGTYALYFNAWKTDFANDPLIAFLGEIDCEIKDFVKEDNKIKGAWKKTKNIGKVIVRRGIPALVKAGTAGIIDAEKIIEEEAVKFVESFTSDAIQLYEKQRSAIDEFKESLKSLINLSSEKKPIVIFVDELDRCRPSYALQLLERIKHLFDVEGIIFVLSMDRNQLNHSVQAVYGSGMDAVGYLRRFIDIDYTLKNPDLNAYINNIFGSLKIKDFFIQRTKKYSEVQYDFDNFYDAFQFLAKIFNFSLRDVEQTLSRIILVCYSGGEQQIIYPWILAYLVVLRDRNYPVYQEYMRKENDESCAINYLYSLTSYGERINSRDCAAIEGFLIQAKNKHNISGSNFIKKYKEKLASANLEQKECEYMELVVRVANSSSQSLHEIDLQSLFNRIEILKQFQFPKE